MDCKQVKAYLSAYIDGFLPAEEKQQVAAHLDACAACRQAAEALLKLRGEIRALKLENTDDFVFDFARAKAPETLPVYRRKWLRTVSACAACFVLLIGVYAAVQNGYQTPAEQKLSAGNAAQDKAAVDVLAIEGEQNAKTQSRQTKNVPMEETFTYRALPESAVMYSSAETQRVVTEKSNAPVDLYADAEADMSTSVTEDALAVPDAVQSVQGGEEADNGSTDVSFGGAASGGVESGAAAPMYPKRTVTLAVSDAAQETFISALTGILLSGFDNEAVIDEANLHLLLALDGVTVVSDASATQETDRYAGKVVILY